jgi:hypothetical protein
MGMDFWIDLSIFWALGFGLLDSGSHGIYEVYEVYRSFTDGFRIGCLCFAGRGVAMELYYTRGGD